MQSNSKIETIDADYLREKVVSIVTNSAAKITPFALEKRLSEENALSKKQIKTAVKELVASGELNYTYEYGSTFLERCFTKAVRVSKYVVLKPPGLAYRSKPNDIVVQINTGASFGAGRHPTTRLAIKGIEYALKHAHLNDSTRENIVLDIGTGTGVLLITAVLFGIKKGKGIDIDPCARFEAAENVKINGLNDRIDISAQEVENIAKPFSMITANLRYPSLVKLSAHLSEITRKQGTVVLSGVRNDELSRLVDVYTQRHLKPVWMENEFGWAGIVFLKSN